MLTNDQSKWISKRFAPTLGSDPELFIARKGQIIGAEKVIPKGGLSAPGGRSAQSQIVLDGVQVELHPTPTACRALMANDFKVIFTKLNEELGQKGANASFEPVVTLTKEEMKTLSEAAQRLGCQPSRNVHNPSATIKVPKGFRQRSAGGHIHVSLNGYNTTRYPEVGSPQALDTLVKILDCVVGLPSVFLDRDPNSAIRRRVYGRAGEHRLPSYGVEYRVLNNYWLLSYQLMSFVMGMTRLGTNILVAASPTFSATSWDAPKELLRRVDYDKVCEAINKNDYNKALKQWAGVESFIDEFYIDTTSGLSTGEPLKNFRYFIEKVREDGIKYWFNHDPIQHWMTLPEGHQYGENGYAGWESYLENAVAEDRASNEVDKVLARLKGAA